MQRLGHRADRAHDQKQHDEHHGAGNQRQLPEQLDSGLRDSFVDPAGDHCRVGRQADLSDMLAGHEWRFDVAPQYIAGKARGGCALGAGSSEWPQCAALHVGKRLPAGWPATFFNRHAQHLGVAQQAARNLFGQRFVLDVAGHAQGALDSIEQLIQAQIRLTHCPLAGRVRGVGNGGEAHHNKRQHGCHNRA